MPTIPNGFNLVVQTDTWNKKLQLIDYVKFSSHFLIVKIQRGVSCIRD